MNSALAEYNFRAMPISLSAIERWAGVTRQTAKEIVKRLSKVISVDLRQNQMLVHLQGRLDDEGSLNISLVNRATDATKQTEAEVRNIHLINHVLKLMKICPSTQSAGMINEMARVLKNRGIKSLYHIYDAIASVFWSIGRMSPRRLNYILRQHYA